MSDIGTLAISMGLDIAELRKDVRQVKSELKSMSNTSEREMRKIDRSVKKTSTAFNGFLKTVRAAALGYATVLATMEISQFTGDIIRQGAALDALQRSYKTITGSAVESNRILGNLKKTANDLGLGLTSLEDSYKNILAASKNTSLEGREIERVFGAVTKASAVLGMSADDTTGTLRALSQMISKGNVQAEELRGQLGERLPGAFQMAAEAMGVTTQQLNKMLEQGQVLASELLPKLADVLESRFGMAAEDAGDRARASFERFGNAIVNIQRAIADSGILDFFADLAESSANVLNLLSEGIRGKTLETQLEGLRNQIQEIENQEQILAEKRDERYRAYLQNEIKTKHQALETAKAIQGSHERSQQEIKTEKEVLEELRNEYKDLQMQVVSFEIADRMNDFRVASVKAKIALQALPPWLEQINTLQKEINNEGLSIVGVTERSKAFQSILDEIDEMTMDSFLYREKLAKREAQAQIDRGFDEVKVQKLLDLKLKKIREERTEHLNGLYEKQVQAAQDAADEKLRIQQELDLALIQNLDAINFTEKERRMRVDQDLYNQTKKILDDRTKAEQDAIKEQERLQEKARKEYLREWERVYDDMHRFAADTFYDLFRETEGFWGNLLDTMEDMFYRSVANMVAHAAMTNIFGPLMQGMAGSSVGNLLGLPSAGGGSGLMGSIGTRIGTNALGSWLGGSGNLSNAVGILGQQTGLWGGGLTQGISVASPGSSWVGAGQFGAPGATTPLGGPAMGSMMAALPFAAIAAFVVPKLIDGFFGDRPSIGFQSNDSQALRTGQYTTLASRTYNEQVNRINQMSARDLAEAGKTKAQMIAELGGGPQTHSSVQKLGQKSKNFDYYLRFADVDSGETQTQIYNYFDGMFRTYEELFDISMNDVLRDAHFITSSGRMDKGGSIKELTDSVFTNILDELVQAVIPDIDSSTFNQRFFRDIAPEDGTQWEAFAEFATVVKNSDDFMARFNERIENVGQTALEAYQQIRQVNVVLADMNTAVEMISGGELTTQLGVMTQTWANYIATMEQLNASTEMVTEAEEKRNLVMGATISGLSAGSIAVGLKSGKTAGDIAAEALQNMINEQIARQIFDELSPVLTNIGKQFVLTGGDIDAARAAMETYIPIIQEMYSGLEDVIDLESQLTEARKDSAQSIQDLIDDLQGGSMAPVQSMEYYANEYELAKLNLQSASTPEEVEAATRKLVESAPDYLEYGAAYAGDRTGIYSDVMTDLRGFTTTPNVQSTTSAGNEALATEIRALVNQVANGTTQVSVNIDAQALEQLLKDGHVTLHRNDEETHIAVKREVA